MAQRKLIARIKGGLGNQLFCYAAARRLALVNDAELVIDDRTGFVRDRLYRRRYMLDHFRIPVRKATAAERLAPFERYRRGAMKFISRSKPFAERRYLEQERLDFDERLLSIKIASSLYLDGLWQSEYYFKDVEEVIREDLRIVPPNDDANRKVAEEIRNSNAVALHVRWFEQPNDAETYNASVDYYKRAFALMEKKVDSPHYFLFSDDPDSARIKISLPEDRVTFVAHNRGDENAYADLWLMTQCRHFITANSTFSWWGAWLGGGNGKIVVTPNLRMEGIAPWGFKGQIPNQWVRV